VYKRQPIRAFVTKEDKLRFRKLASLLQSKGRKPPKIKKQEGHFHHELANDIVKIAKERNATIVLENIKGLKTERIWEHVPFKTKPKKLKRNINYLLSMAPLRKIQSIIEYKAKLLGIEVLYIAPANTSKVCSECMALEDYVYLPIHTIYTKRYGDKFSCSNCGKNMHADENAAINIACRGLALSLFYKDGKIVNENIRNKVKKEKRLWKQTRKELKKMEGTVEEKNYILAYERAQEGLKD
jgi:IS605 OrfB family transposase